MSSSSAPRDAATVDEILRSMGVTDYEPGVLHQLLTFMHAHCAEVFSEGADYAAHAGRTAVECEDVRLACRLKSAEAQVTSAPFLEWLARERNGQPLPAAPTSTSGIQLPPQKFCLLAANYDLVPRAPAVEAAEDETPSQLRSGAEPPVRPKSAGPRIPIHLGAAQAATDALAPAQPAREGSGDAAMAEALDDDELWD